MQIAVLGAGMVGQAFASGLTARSHTVTIGTRDPGSTRERLADWSTVHPGVTLTDLSTAAASAELVFNALNGSGTLEGLSAAGAENLAGKVLVDVSNALDPSSGFPPALRSRTRTLSASRCSVSSRTSAWSRRSTRSTASSWSTPASSQEVSTPSS